ncbi:hypothetical protein MKW98_010350 [Papaver atlanticum]|uniref:Uncharacterized protein n=1 Tax=Papaver atlanticum TaxID=357466 RepID=A0AAD4XGY5_9MAGN|nr:hypothetical protein MKW98_010350 [Papaver atlanticum]
MEKLNLARNICKAVYGFRYGTINKRLRNIAGEFCAINDDFYKVRADPNFRNALSNCPKLIEEDEHFHKVAQQAEKAVSNFTRGYTHFKQHEEPNLDSFNLFKSYVAPSVAATMAGVLLVVTTYKKHLRKKYKEKLHGVIALKGRTFEGKVPST